MAISLEGGDETKNVLLNIVDILQRSVKLASLKPPTKAQELENTPAQRVQ